MKLFIAKQRYTLLQRFQFQDGGTETVNKYYLGGFTPKKYEIFCREVGVTDLTGVEEKYIREYALKFKRYLEAHPEYEDDGTRITVTVIG